MSRRSPRRRAASGPDPAERLERRLGSRTELGIVLGLLAVSIGLRVLLLLEFAGAPGKAADAELFLDTAGRIANGDVFLHGHSLPFSPLYFYFLAGIFATVGEKLWLVLVLQCVIGVGAQLLLWRLARAVFGRLSALTTLTLHTFCGVILFYEVQLMDATFSIALVTVLLVALHRADSSARARTWLTAGAVLGLLALTRPNVLLFLPAAALLALRPTPQRPERRTRILAAAGVAAGTLLCVLPFTVRNEIETGEPVLITAHGGINFYVGNNESATGFFTPPHGMPPLPGPFNLDIPRAAAERATGRTGMRDGEVSSYWFARGVDFIREHPGRWLALTLRKVRAYLNGREVPINVEFDFFRSLSTPLKIAFLPMGALLPLGLLGVALSRPRWREQLVFSVFLAVTSASVILFFVASRYRLPIVPVLLLYAGFAVRSLLADLAHSRRLAASSIGLALLLLFCNSDLDLRVNPAYVAHSRGYTLETMERYDDAIRWYRRALAANPSLVLTHLHLARIYARRGDAERTGEHYEAALRLAPGDPAIRAEVEQYRDYMRARGGP